MSKRSPVDIAAGADGAAMLTEGSVLAGGLGVSAVGAAGGATASAGAGPEGALDARIAEEVEVTTEEGV